MLICFENHWSAEAAPRKSGFEEAFTIIRTLLQEGAIDFDGTYYTARDCEMAPRGPRRSGPPLMIGSSGPRMLGITLPHVQIWNNWLCREDNTAAQIPDRRAVVDAACAKAGVAPADIERSVSIVIDQSGRGDLPTSMAGDGVKPLTGSVDEIAAGLQAFADEGIGHLQFCLAPNTLESVEQFRKVLEAMGRG